MKESEEMRLKSTINESTLSTADAVPLPRWGRQRNENTDIPISSKRIQDMWKNNNGGQSLPPWGRLRNENTAIPEIKPSPRGEGGERSEPDRVLAV